MMPTACKSSAATVIAHLLRSSPVLPPIRQSAKCAPDRFAGRSEPMLSELLADSVLERLMVRDQVSMNDLLALISDVRTALQRR
ncbi:MAG TPA: hypothetical protein VN809_16905 [Telmatospirillum sp.]|nr:hypothetical protein [Telmatospirillum sp.]